VSRVGRLHARGARYIEPRRLASAAVGAPLRRFFKIALAFVARMWF